MELFISREKRPPNPRHAYLNPRHFSGLAPDVTKVWLDGDWPEIAEACKAAGVKVVRIDRQPAQPVVSEPPADLGAKLRARSRAPVSTPAVSDAG